MTVLTVFAVIFGFAGIIGSVVPGLPGPPLSWFGLLLLRFAGLTNNSVVLVWLGIMLFVTALDYILPAFFTKISGGSKAGVVGSVIGLLLGIVFTPIGMIWGSLIGAFVGEYIVSRNSAGGSIKAALGNFAGFILTTGLKLTCSFVMLYYIIAALF